MYKTYAISYHNVFSNKTLNIRQPESSINKIGIGRRHFVRMYIAYCVAFTDAKTTQNEHNTT